MGRATTKDDLISSANTNFEKLNAMIESMENKELLITFDFSSDEKKKESHWRRDKNLRDIYIHLYEWHQLVLNWVNSNVNGIAVPFLPEPYNWKTYLDMNIELWNKHQGTLIEKAKEIFLQSHKDVLALAETFTSDELFAKDVFNWVGGSTLGAYFVSSTASHYEWGMKKLKAHKKAVK